MKLSVVRNGGIIYSLWWMISLLCAGCNTPEVVQSEDLEARLATYSTLSQEEKTSPAYATQTFQVADDLAVNVFAAEPDVVNPTNIDVDARGRVWVCEAYNYGVPEEERTQTGGRITILEDTDQDGVADSRKVFYQGEEVDLAEGIAVLGNQVYVTRSPNMLVFTDEDYDDVPDRIDKLWTGMGGPGDHSAHALVFGPDGRFYFNMGNMGYEVYDSVGNIVVDRAGNEVKSNGAPYIGGMAFRFNQDGSNFEVLGHNFRNNYELTVDSYGTIWQSDNDDDGNQSCRINQVLEYGNYGYRDELTQAGWRTPRTNLEESIPEQHWHQNDPGVVPNLLITGAGSPAGITFYEGTLLPEAFQNQIVHTDAGPNMVWAVQTKPTNTGYEAATAPIVQSLGDQWFRPVDVCVAPDGSLIVADWYDPGVGGGAAGDSEKGRIFRVAPPGSVYQTKYQPIEDGASAIAALKSPNMATRYEGWQYLHQQGGAVERELVALWQDDNPVFRARALWLLGFIDAEKYVNEALSDSDPKLRMTGIRVARQQKLDLPTLVMNMADDPSSEVKRELAIALRYETSVEAGQAWAQLANGHQAGDRWMLEALGIGAMDNWENAFAAWHKTTPKQYEPHQKELIWRARTTAALEPLATVISSSSTSEEEIPRYFRAFDFHEDQTKNEVLMQLLTADEPDRQAIINRLVLRHLNADHIEPSPEFMATVRQTLEQNRGTIDYISIVEQFALTEQTPELLKLLASDNHEVALLSGNILLREPFNANVQVRQQVYQDTAQASAIIPVLAQISEKEALDLLTEFVLSDQLTEEHRKKAIQGLANSWSGEDYLLNCVKEESFPESLQPMAASVLFNVYRTEIHQEAAKYLPAPGGREGNPLPPIRDMVSRAGNPQEGQVIFKSLCASCHQVGGEGINFGPALSQISNKLPKEGLYRAIIYPNEGVNYDYEGVNLLLADGSRTMGIVESENNQEVVLRQMGGSRNSYAKNDIQTRERMEQSLMPNLTTAMSEEQLVNLVEYLASLK
ncbi:MAG: PVC-type heme-binding CxxCH protein [Bacteroidota bacterium]